MDNRENAPRLGEIGEVSEKKWQNEIANIFTEAANRINLLEEEARSALSSSPRDVETYEAKLREKGEELVNLPDKVRMLAANLDRNRETDLMRTLDSFAMQARVALEEKNPYIASALLTALTIRKGSQVGERNMLEELADELQQK